MHSGTIEKRFHAFGNACHLIIEDGTAHGGALLERAEAEIRRLEAKFSTYSPSSLVSLINERAGSGQWTPIDEETRSLLHYIGVLWQESRELFDPTAGVLQNLYPLSGAATVPAPEKLEAGLARVGWADLEHSAEGLHLQRKGMSLDINSCIRPYAVDCTRKLLMEEGVLHALIDLERDVATIGKQPDGANWLVGLRHPRGPQLAISRLKVNQQGYAIRGDFEKALILDGERYGRALSPVDGQPIPGLLAVVVLADNCLTACSAATLARLKTEQNALSWLSTVGFPWLAIDRQLHCHGPLAPR